MILRIRKPFTYCRIYLLILLCSFSCQNSNSHTSQLKATVEPLSKTVYPKALQDGLEAHGGIDQWGKMKTMHYDLVKEKLEHHIIDLKNRKCLIQQEENWKIGYDGEDVWVQPDMETYGGKSARFYHNLYFYFFAMPFVLADPGIKYEVLPLDSLLGIEYQPVKISYHKGIGDAPDDVYIAYFNTTNNEMGALLYTVTYYSGIESDSYKALIYDNWTTVNGLKLPKSFKGYKYNDGKLGELRYERKFENIVLSELTAEQAIFEKPEDAVLDKVK